MGHHLKHPLYDHIGGRVGPEVVVFPPPKDVRALAATRPSHAQELLDNLTSEQLAELIDDLPLEIRERLKRALDWGRRIPELEEVTIELASAIETGRLDLSKNPARIKEICLELISQIPPSGENP